MISPYFLSLSISVQGFIHLRISMFGTVEIIIPGFSEKLQLFESHLIPLLVLNNMFVLSVKCLTPSQSHKERIRLVLSDDLAGALVQ